VRVTVLLFARYREAAGRPALEVEAQEGATLQGIWEKVQEAVPALAGERRPLFACDRAHARPDRVVTGREEIAVFPPVSGG
jgi:molybdopterin converting factor small subunit